jgi:hypothetical protein
MLERGSRLSDFGAEAQMAPAFSRWSRLASLEAPAVTAVAAACVVAAVALALVARGILR